MVCNDVYHTHTHVMGRLPRSQQIPHYPVAGVLLFGLCYLLALVEGQIENLFGVTSAYNTRLGRADVNQALHTNASLDPSGFHP